MLFRSGGDRDRGLVERGAEPARRGEQRGEVEQEAVADVDRSGHRALPREPAALGEVRAEAQVRAQARAAEDPEALLE